MISNLPFVRGLTSPWAAGVILIVFFAAMNGSLHDKSITFDELAHLTAGYSYWENNDYRLQPENGNLPQRLEALPLLLGIYPFPSFDSAAWKTSDEWTVGYEWLYHQGNDPRRMLALGRAAAAVVTVALGVVVWAWSRRLFGPAAGMLSLILFVTNPNVLANGALMTSDLACSFFMIAAVGMWSRFLRSPSFLNLLASAVVTGCTLVSKPSGVLILPLLGLLAIFYPIYLAKTWLFTPRWIVRGLGLLLLYAATLLIVVWGFYGFRYAAMSPGLMTGSRMGVTWETLLQGDGSPSMLRSLVAFAQQGHLLPEAYLYGIAFVSDLSVHRSGFLNGEVSLNGWSIFFPYAFLVKNPLPVFVFLGWAGALLFTRSLKGGIHSEVERHRRFGILSLVLLIVIYGAMALLSHLNIGQRHLLPLYAPLFILCGVVVSAWSFADETKPSRWTGWKSALIAGLSSFLLCETIAWYPNYLAYFNVLGGGSARSYRHLVDSSLDWGQDLPAVQEYIHQHPADAPFYLSYFGNGSPASYSIEATLLYSSPGWDVTPLTQVTPSDVASKGLFALYDPVKVYLPLEAADTTVWLEKSFRLRWRGGTYLISATMLQPVLYSPQNGPWGPWNLRYESIYRDLQSETRPLLNDELAVRVAALSRHPAVEWNAIWSRYEQFRLARLTAYLRQREPSSEIGGGSILVYCLTDDEIIKALDGTPAELKPDPRWALNRE